MLHSEQVWTCQGVVMRVGGWFGGGVLGTCSARSKFYKCNYVQGVWTRIEQVWAFLDAGARVLYSEVQTEQVWTCSGGNQAWVLYRNPSLPCEQRDGETDTTDNITFSQLSWRTVNIRCSTHRIYFWGHGIWWKLWRRWECVILENQQWTN